MIIELVVALLAYVTNSMALVADSFHMLSDVVSIVIAFISVKVTLFALSNTNSSYISLSFCCAQISPVWSKRLKHLKK